MALNIITSCIEKNKQTVELEQQTISEVCETLVSAMVKGLPNEAHTIEVFDYVLQQTKELIRNKVIELK